MRRRRTGTLIVFVVDASASMDAEQRMQATKGAVLSLLRDAYLRRDKVSLVVFSGRAARVVLQPTSSVDLAEQRLQRLTVGRDDAADPRTGRRAPHRAHRAAA